jgi:hypothetical protein
MARLRRTPPNVRQLIGVDRKWLANCQSHANDRCETSNPISNGCASGHNAGGEYGPLVAVW